MDKTTQETITIELDKVTHDKLKTLATLHEIAIEELCVIAIQEYLDMRYKSHNTIVAVSQNQEFFE